MGKHAYLIIAHNEFDILKKLLKMIDREENDIFLHIDKKVKNFDEKNICKLVEKSNLKLIRRIKVSWGGDTQITCELLLLKAAIKNKYDYYHLISGTDLPIKNSKYIYDFFNNNKGKNFIEFDSKAENNNCIEKRIAQYHIFSNKMSSKNKIYNKILKSADALLVTFQRFLKIDRTKKSMHSFYKGTNWFSITHDMAKYILKNEEFIKKYCYKSLCADEIFLQTIAKKSPYKNTIVNDSLRLIDWNRGKPYVYRENDFDEIINSNKLWARKFSEKKDIKIVNMIYNYILKEQE